MKLSSALPSCNTVAALVFGVLLSNGAQSKDLRTIDFTLRPAASDSSNFERAWLKRQGIRPCRTLSTLDGNCDGPILGNLPKVVPEPEIVFPTPEQLAEFKAWIVGKLELKKVLSSGVEDLNGDGVIDPEAIAFDPKMLSRWGLPPGTRIHFEPLVSSDLKPHKFGAEAVVVMPLAAKVFNGGEITWNAKGRGQEASGFIRFNVNF